MIKLSILFLPLILYMGYEFESASGSRNNSSNAYHYENTNLEQALPEAMILAETCTFTIKCPKDTFYCFQPGLFVTYGLKPLEVTSKGDCSFTISYVVTGPNGIKVPGTGNNASGLFLPGKSVVAWTVKDNNTGASTPCATNVTVNSPIIVAVTSNPQPLGAAANTVYIGFESADYIAYRVKDLTASPSGGSPPFTYSWADENKGTIQTPNANVVRVKPVEAGSVIYTVTVKDSKGCTATNSITVKAIDISCVNGKAEGVWVCEVKHNKSRCFQEKPAIDGVKAGRFTLGPCNAGNKEGQGMLQDSNFPESRPSLNARVFQNPTSHYFTVKIESANISEKVMVKVANFAGTVVEQRLVNANQTLTLGDSYRSGSYYLLITQGKEKLTLSLKKL